MRGQQNADTEFNVTEGLPTKRQRLLTSADEEILTTTPIEECSTGVITRITTLNEEVHNEYTTS